MLIHCLLLLLYNMFSCGSAVQVEGVSPMRMRHVQVTSMLGTNAVSDSLPGRGCMYTRIHSPLYTPGAGKELNNALTTHPRNGPQLGGAGACTYNQVDRWVYGIYMSQVQCFHLSNTNWVMGPLSPLLNPIVLGSSSHTGNVRQNHRVTQQ